MEFWGVEVKAGEPLKVNPGDDKVLHLSQVSLGEVKKDKKNESVLLYVNVDGQKLVFGTLSHEKCAQINVDFVFEKEFELSHNWKNGSVYFVGYTSVFTESNDHSDTQKEEIPLQASENGKSVQKQAKLATGKTNPAKLGLPEAKSKVKTAEPEKGNTSKEDDDEEEDDSDDDEDDSDEDKISDEDILDAANGSSDDEDEETPTPPPKKDKKRPLASAAITPDAAKKAKFVTPQKIDVKKGGGRTATPHPSKQAAKIPASDDKSKGQQTPKSAGQFSCKSCNKSFSSDRGLHDHNKAKHSAGK